MFDCIRSRVRDWRLVSRNGAPKRTESEATAARRQAEIQLLKTRAETPYYADLGNSLRQIREANHLTELFFANRVPHDTNHLGEHRA